MEKLRTSAKRLHQAVDKRVEISVLLTEIFNLSNRVNHGGMMLPAKALPNLWEGGVRESFAQIHGDLARHCH